MTTREQTVRLVKLHRWALEEMYYDERCKLANQMYGETPRKLYRILRNKYGARGVLARCCRYLQASKLELPAGLGFHHNVPLKTIGKVYPWLMGELISESIIRGSIKVIKGKTSGMYLYLLKFYSEKEILGCLKWLVIMQRKRRKTLSMLDKG